MVLGARIVGYNTEAGATYVELSSYDEVEADHTVEVINALVTVDVNNVSKPIGVEVLRAPAEIDAATLRPVIERGHTVLVRRAGLGHQRVIGASGT